MRIVALFAFILPLLTVFATPQVQANSCQQQFQNFSGAWLAAGRFTPEDFNALAPQDLTNLATDRPGPRLFTATYQGQTVIGKRVPGGKLREAAWLRELNKLGVGVKLHGLVRLRDGELYFVMENVPGINTNQPIFGAVIKQNAFAEMRRQFEILAANEIFPVDLQFQVSPSGKVAIVDPEYFEIKNGLAERPERLWQLLSVALKMNFEIEP